MPGRMDKNESKGGSLLIFEPLENIQSTLDAPSKEGRPLPLLHHLLLQSYAHQFWKEIFYQSVSE